jgi:putative tricarboxylic transport membrane protein
MDAGTQEARPSRAPDLVAAAAVFALGLAAFAGALGLGYWSHGPGPGFFPLWLGALLVLLGGVWAGQLVRGRNVHEPEPVSPGGWHAVALVLAALLVATLLLDVVGYQLAMTALVLFVLLVVGKRRVIESVVVALLAGFGIYALFANVLQVYLPTAGVPFLAEMGL